MWCRKCAGNGGAYGIENCGWVGVESGDLTIRTKIESSRHRLRIPMPAAFLGLVAS